LRWKCRRAEKHSGGLQWKHAGTLSACVRSTRSPTGSPRVDPSHGPVPWPELAVSGAPGETGLTTPRPRHSLGDFLQLPLRGVLPQPEGLLQQASGHPYLLCHDLGGLPPFPKILGDGSFLPLLQVGELPPPGQLPLHLQQEGPSRPLEGGEAAVPTSPTIFLSRREWYGGPHGGGAGGHRDGSRGEGAGEGAGEESPPRAPTFGKICRTGMY